MKSLLTILGIFIAIFSFGQSVEIDHSKPSIIISKNGSDHGIELGYFNPGSQLIGNHLKMKNQSGGGETLRFFGGNQTDGPYIHLFDQTGTQRIRLEAEYFTINGPKGRVITDQLEIKAGSDLAEYFNVDANSEIKEGHLASIDPDHPGQLILTHKANDKSVAGIISGANGLSTGMFMGQQGSIADGSYPIALAGRAYVYASREHGDIIPGDFLTSSSTPGYAMKVKKRKKAAGSIIGKAMSPIDENGFVLVLINLQ